MSEPVKIIIVIEGGIVQSVLTLGVPVEALLIDYDTEGAQNEPVNVPGGAGGEQEAIVETLLVERAPAALANFALSQFAGGE